MFFRWNEEQPQQQKQPHGKHNSDDARVSVWHTTHSFFGISLTLYMTSYYVWENYSIVHSFSVQWLWFIWKRINKYIFFLVISFSMRRRSIPMEFLLKKCHAFFGSNNLKISKHRDIKYTVPSLSFFIQWEKQFDLTFVFLLLFLSLLRTGSISLNDRFQPLPRLLNEKTIWKCGKKA